ncbi:uncharacterized protein LOC125446516 [Stegostoma tigrinum]|uniref:uncharacterized protein LOC125446516 n=1 Tax=Stegostoma tigrinum TaxID=3053191 RepID=UPI0028704972|nr:uncharacterized protein LOC125446516 [Stegostoma tigrinum]
MFQLQAGAVGGHRAQFAEVFRLCDARGARQFEEMLDLNSWLRGRGTTNDTRRGQPPPRPDLPSVGEGVTADGKSQGINSAVPEDSACFARRGAPMCHRRQFGRSTDRSVPGKQPRREQGESPDFGTAPGLKRTPAKRRAVKILYPAQVRKYMPPEEKDWAKRMLLLLLCVVAVQVYAAAAEAQGGTVDAIAQAGGPGGERAPGLPPSGGETLRPANGSAPPACCGVLQNVIPQAGLSAGGTPSGFTSRFYFEKLLCFAF